FLALPRSRHAADAEESSAIMLMPQAFLAGLCIVLGLFPGAVLKALDGVLATLAGVRPQSDVVPNAASMASGGGAFDQVIPAALGVVTLAGLGIAAVLAMRARMPVRRAPTWGWGGELTARTEYTATAFSKPLMMIFRGIYRPTRQVEALAEVSPYFPKEVRYHSEIEPTFERFVYRPLTQGVF